MAGRVEESDRKETLLLVPSNQEYKGYKRGLVSQQLSPMEQSLLVCAVCSGIMHNPCNYGNGQRMCCEACLAKGEVAQEIGAIRTMVSNLKGSCPLAPRGCAWEGTLGELWRHLDTCEVYLVSCPYEGYGCARVLRRGHLDKHRREEKDQHTELVTMYLGNRVEQQEMRIGMLERMLEEMKEERRYCQLREAMWRMENVAQVEDAFRQQKGLPMKQRQQQQQQQRQQQQQQRNIFGQQAFPTQYGAHQANPGAQYGAQNYQTCFAGPTFQLSSLHVQLQLELKEDSTLCLKLADLSQNQGIPLMAQCPALGYPQQQAIPNPGLYHQQGHLITSGVTPNKPRTGDRVMFKLTLFNRINPADNWVKEVGPVPLKMPVTLTELNTGVFLSEEFCSEGTVLIQLLHFLSPL